MLKVEFEPLKSILSKLEKSMMAIQANDMLNERRCGKDEGRTLKCRLSSGSE